MHIHNDVIIPGVIFGDTHFGSNGGLLPPGYVDIDGAEVGLNPGQRYLWECWEDFCKRVGKLKPKFIIANGDIVEGTQAKERGAGLSLRMMTDQKKAAIIGLKKLKRAAGKDCKFYFTQGCVTPGHKTLTANLEWVNIESLKKGDLLIAPEESRRLRGRHWELSEVTDVLPVTKPCCEIELDNGEFLECTTDHPWLVYNGSAYKWTLATELRPGISRMVNIIKPWNGVDKYDLGWLGGFFDGEGSLNQAKYNSKWGYTSQLSASQNHGPVINRAREILDKYQIPYGIYQNERDNCELIQISGGASSVIRALGLMRPVRLLEKFNPSIVGRMKAQGFAKVKNIRMIGNKEVVGLSTSSNTYVINGYGSHNTKYHVGENAEYEEGIAQELDAQKYSSIGAGDLVREVLWLNINGVIIEASHPMGGSTGFYRSTALDREMQWSAMAGKDESKGIPRADLIARSHVHYFNVIEHASKQGVIVPCWQLQMKYARRASVHRMHPDIGGIFVEVSPRAKRRGEPACKIIKQLYNLPPVPITKL